MTTNQLPDLSGLNKEQVYDEHISPLMTAIIEICQARGIAMLASFAIPTDEDGGLCCTSILPDETGDNTPEHKAALRILRNGVGAQAVAFTITSPKVGGNG